MLIGGDRGGSSTVPQARTLHFSRAPEARSGWTYTPKRCDALGVKQIKMWKRRRLRALGWNQKLREVKTCHTLQSFSGGPLCHSSFHGSANQLLRWGRRTAPYSFRPIVRVSVAQKPTRLQFHLCFAPLLALIFRHAHSQPRARAQSSLRMCVARGSAGSQSGWRCGPRCRGGEEGPEAWRKPQWGPCWRGEIKWSSGEERGSPGGAGGWAQRGWRERLSNLLWLPGATGLRPSGTGRLWDRSPPSLQMEKLRPWEGTKGCTTREVVALSRWFYR